VVSHPLWLEDGASKPATFLESWIWFQTGSRYPTPAADACNQQASIAPGGQQAYRCLKSRRFQPFSFRLPRLTRRLSERPARAVTIRVTYKNRSRHLPRC